MSNQRHRTGEKLQANVRAEIPRVAVAWLAAVRDPLEVLTVAALSGEISDEEFVKMVEAFSESLPGLLPKMDIAPLAGLMEKGMGAAMANGLTANDQLATDKEEKRAKLPWERDAYLAAQKRRKDGKFGEGDGTTAGKEQRMDLGKPWEGSQESMRSRAQEGMSGLKKRMQHPETGFEMDMGGEAMKKTLRQAKTPEEFMAAASMGEIFLNSKKNAPEPDRKGRRGIKAFHTFSTPVRIAGVNREAVITVTEWEANNDPGKQVPRFKLFRLRSNKKGT